MNHAGHVELLADRFVLLDRSRAIDLATGDRVVIVTGTAGGPSDQTRWAVRCDRFMRMGHRAVAPIIDYGLCGEMQRFEAWRCDGAWGGTAADGARAVALAQLFLRANGFTMCTAGAATLQSLDGQPVVLPDASAGYDSGEGPQVDGALTVPVCGLAAIHRQAVQALSEVFAPPTCTRPRAVAIWGPPGGGVRLAARQLARVARLHGFVPIGLNTAASPLIDAVRERSLFLIYPSSAPAGMRGIVDATLRTPRPHVLLFAGRTEVPGVPGVGLDRIPPAVLVDAVRPFGLPPALRRRMERCAGRSKGAPGRFERLVWGHRPAAQAGVLASPARGVSIAAEGTAAYGGVPSLVPRPRRWAQAGDLRLCPAPSEVVGLQRRLDAGIKALEAGRHASGERDVRGAGAGLARRGDHAQAARAQLALAASLLKRGRPRDAQSVLADARQLAFSDDPNGVLVQLAVLSGVAATDTGRLDEAEHTLQAAVMAASGDEPAAAARLALARCLFWRGQYAEAGQCLRALSERGPALNPATAVRMAIAASRIAVGSRDLAEAVGQAAEALRASEALAGPALRAHAACAAAFAHLSVGDHGGVARDVAVCVRAARLARDPLCALRARLLAAESDRRSGRAAPAVRLLKRVARLSNPHLPPIVRARCALLADLHSPGAAPDVVARHVTTTGLAALALFAPPASHHRPELSAAMDEALEILRFCQTADDDEVLPEVCGRLRKRLRAAGAAFYVLDGPALVPVASEGGRVEPRIAARVLDARQPISPCAVDGVIEGGCPVRFGGDVLGALVVRWTLGALGDAAGAASALTLAAAVAAPALAAAVARRRAPPLGVGDLIGVSPALEDVRRAVDRAAAAPFAVLVEGESGSGKELVARALHRRSPRRDRAFCTVNCAALPDDLVESELFGHARGAFTGAVAERAGVFEEAHTGTLFLDEIGELSPRAQAKVLRTIQEGELRRVGENISRRVDVRVVAATNRDLKREVAAGRFRLDLFYRLDVLRITVPALRDRREDIAVLAEHFWRDAANRVNSRAVLNTATIAALARYHWPGNVRELQNVMAALAVRSPRRGVVPPTALPPIFGAGEPSDTWKLDTARRTFEERFVRAALVRSGGHRGRAAEELGVTRQGLTKLMVRLGISERAAP